MFCFLSSFHSIFQQQQPKKNPIHFHHLHTHTHAQSMMNFFFFFLFIYHFRLQTHTHSFVILQMNIKKINRHEEKKILTIIIPFHHHWRHCVQWNKHQITVNSCQTSI